MSRFPITKREFDRWVTGLPENDEQLALSGDGRMCPLARALWDRGYREQEVTADWHARSPSGRYLEGITPTWACIFAALVDEPFGQHPVYAGDIREAWEKARRR